MAEQTACPISLEEFTPETLEFRHGGVRFCAHSLHQYLTTAPGSANPVNRLPFLDKHLQELNELVTKNNEAAPVLLSAAAAAAQRRLDLETESILVYLDDRARSSVHCFSTEWYDELLDVYLLSLYDCQDELHDLRRDTMSYSTAAWELTLQGLKSMTADMRPAPFVQRDLDHMWRHLSTDYTGGDSSSDEDESEEDDNIADVATAAASILSQLSAIAGEPVVRLHIPIPVRPHTL